MQTMPIERAEGHLVEIVENLRPGDEIVFTHNDRPVATLRAAHGESARPVPGRGKGMLIVHSEDDDHLQDFAEYMP